MKTLSILLFSLLLASTMNAQGNYALANQVITDCEGTLTDSGNNANYADNEDITFTIAPEGANGLTLTFNTWEVESGYDFIYIYDGASTASKMIGSYSASSPATVESTTGQLTVRFVSDESVNKSGWTASWTSFGRGCATDTSNDCVDVTTVFAETNCPKISAPVCGCDDITYDNSCKATAAGVVSFVAGPCEKVAVTRMGAGSVTACEGRLSDSGGETAHYGSNESLRMTIEPGAQIINLEFTEWDIEAGYDFLYIYDGTSDKDPLIGTYSATAPSNVIANSGKMLLVFTSDASVTGGGFQATWSSAGGACSTLAPPPVADFAPTSNDIIVGQGVQFLDNSSANPTGWLWTVHGNSPSFFTDQNPVMYFPIPGTYTVTLTAYNAFGHDIMINRDIVVREETAELSIYTMNNQTITDCEGILYDSGETSNYTDNEDYIVTIAPEGANDLTITFESWDVEAGYDGLYIYEGNSTEARLMGTYSTTAPNTLTSSTGSFTLRFTSDESVNKGGFRATWTSFGRGCGGGNANYKTVINNEMIFDEITEKQAMEVAVFPNPTADFATITASLNKETSTTLNLLDLNGRLIETRILNAVSINERIDLSNLAAGIYLVQLKGEGMNEMKKVVKK